MNKRFSKFIFFLMLLSGFIFFSCEVGLGEAVDTEAPKITIDYLNQRQSFGTALFLPEHVQMILPLQKSLFQFSMKKIKLLQVTILTSLW